MGFTKYFVPEPKDFYNYLERVGPLTLVGIKKFDALIGDSHSIAMLEKLYELAKAKLSEEEILKELKTMLN